MAISRIEIEKAPDKVKYLPGEAIDLTGIVVKAYEEGTKYDKDGIVIKKVTMEPFDASELSYKGYNGLPYSPEIPANDGGYLIWTELVNGRSYYVTSYNDSAFLMPVDPTDTWSESSGIYWIEPDGYVASGATYFYGKWKRNNRGTTSTDYISTTDAFYNLTADEITEGITEQEWGTVPVEELSYEPIETSELGTLTVTVTWGGKSATFDVTVEVVTAKELLFNGMEAADYGVRIAGEGAYNAPARRGEMVTIPGRNGTLFVDEDSFENIEVTYPAFIGTKDARLFATRLRKLRSDFSAVKTYARLEDKYHPDEFRMGVFHAGVETDPKYYTRAGEFDLTFDCKPHRFLKSGEVPVKFSALGNIENPTPFTARPLLMVDGNGQFSIGDYQVSVSGSDEPFWIDTELMEAYVPAGDTYRFTDENNVDMTDEHGFILTFADGYVTPKNMLQYVTFKNHEFPMIEPGIQPVEVSGLTLTIVPRWWML